jgi:hypothetical protein
MSNSGSNFGVSTALMKRADGTGRGTLPVPHPWNSVGIVMRAGDVVEVYSGEKVKEAPGVEKVDSIAYLPFANGTAPDARAGDLNFDFDDNTEIADRMCESVWRFVYGANSASFCEDFSRSLAPEHVATEPIVCDIFERGF